MSEDTIPRKNAESVMQTLKDMEALMRAMKVTVDSLNGMVASVTERVAVLERDAAEHRISKMGHGPTEIGNGD